MRDLPEESRLERLVRTLPIDTRALGAVRRPHFLQLLAQQFAALAATFAISFASLAKVVELTGSGVQAAFTILSVVVPGLLFGLLGGVTVDRVSRRTMLIVTNLLRGLLAVAAPLYLDLAPPEVLVPVILSVNFLLSAVGQFNFPAEAALIPYLVSSEELLAANSLFNISYLAAIGFGSVVWGPLSVRFLGVEWSYFGSGLFFLISLLPLSRLPKDPAPRERVLRRSRYARLRHVMAVVADVREGVVFALTSPSVGVAILALASQTALALAMVAVFPVVMATEFGIPIYNQPLLALPAISGAGLGFLVLVSPFGNRQPRTRLVVGGNALIALGLTGMTISLSLLEWGIRGVLASFPLVGIGFVLAYISGKSVLQEEPPDYLRGRVISLQLTLNNVVSLVPTVLAGWGLDVLGPTAVFVAATVSFALLTVLAWLLVRAGSAQYR
ncbi:MAG: MFS transporter [Anaerolineae bacterium]|nr:MFS transporter [Anaerolineae bacterium]